MFYLSNFKNKKWAKIAFDWLLSIRLKDSDSHHQIMNFKLTQSTNYLFFEEK